MVTTGFAKAEGEERLHLATVGMFCARSFAFRKANELAEHSVSAEVMLFSFIWQLATVP